MACRTTSNRKIFVYQENKSKLTLENLDEVESESVKVDGCEINDKSIRCDFLHIAKDVEFYIELKGQDLKHALEQIKATIKKLSSNKKLFPKRSYIICTRSPLSSTEIQNYKREFKKDYNSELIIKSSPHTDKY
ncbi:hypothetical protein [Chryseobacterium aquaticum]|uniref:hypothetical protein n=1 Tax=Chryseobacterium aquaticum TaxID=452084 RepID=UPI002FC9ED18